MINAHIKMGLHYQVSIGLKKKNFNLSEIDTEKIRKFRRKTKLSFSKFLLLQDQDQMEQ